MRATTTLILLYVLLLSCSGCIEPKPLHLSDIKIPDPEGDLAKHLGILAIEEVGWCEYYYKPPVDDYFLNYDTLNITTYDTNGVKTRIIEFGFWPTKTSYYYGDEGLLEITIRPYGDGDFYHCYDLFPDSNLLVHNICPYILGDNTYSAVGCMLEKVFLDGQGIIQEQLIKDIQGVFYHYDTLGRLISKVVYDLPESHERSIKRFNKASVDYYTWVTSTYYYYRGNGVLLDSIVQKKFDNKGKDLHGGYTQFYDHTGYPILKRYKETDQVYILKSVLHSADQAKALEEGWENMARGGW